MFCTHCGNQLPDGSFFCNRCGARVGAVQGNPPMQSAGRIQQPRNLTGSAIGTQASYAAGASASGGRAAGTAAKAGGGLFRKLLIAGIAVAVGGSAISLMSGTGGETGGDTDRVVIQEVKPGNVTTSNTNPGDGSGKTVLQESQSKPALTGDRITSVSDMYIMTEQNVYSNLGYQGYADKADIPSDIEVTRLPANVSVSIDGNNVKISFPEIINAQYATLSRYGDERYWTRFTGSRDAVTFYGTILASGETREETDAGVYSDSPCYYLMGTIDSMKNDLIGGNSFAAMQRAVDYGNANYFANTTYGCESLYIHEETLDGGRYYRGESVFEIIYFPEDKYYQCTIMTLMKGTISVEQNSSEGYQQDSTDTVFKHDFILASDLSVPMKLTAIEDKFEYNLRDTLNSGG